MGNLHKTEVRKIAEKTNDISNAIEAVGKEIKKQIKEHGKVLAAMGGGAGIAVMMGGL